jgi:hypothetical protein
MFKYYTFNGDEYTIVDDNLGEMRAKRSKCVYEDIIEVYSEKGLPVVPELIRCLLFIKNYRYDYPSRNIMWFFEDDKYRKIRAPYQDEIDKYLLLL